MEEPISMRLAQLESQLGVLAQPNYIENLTKALRRTAPDLQRSELADVSAQVIEGNLLTDTTDVS
jgi:hypothetical protein